MTVPSVAAVLEPRIRNTEVATCGMIELEILFSARSADDIRRTLARLRAGFERLPTEDGDFHRATDVMAELALRGHHRAARIPDLLIAAVAERAGLVLVHYDHDFDRIAEVTGQATEWVVPRGSRPERHVGARRASPSSSG
jgi:predicted nucleic acid-binding protein